LPGGTAALLSFLALIAFPLGALVFCTGPRKPSTSAGQGNGQSDKSMKSKSVSKSMMAPNSPEATASDHRVQWAAGIVE
ncbi:hypothetical protein PMAYCL1PPCAC_12859, partial [Pristionchus mayeri]